MSVTKQLINKDVKEFFERILLEKNDGSGNEQLMNLIEDLYRQFSQFNKFNYKPSKSSCIYFIETALIESKMTTLCPSASHLIRIKTVGNYLSDYDKVLEIFVGYFIQSIFYFKDQTEDFIKEILHFIDSHDIRTSLAYAYSQIMMYYSSKREFEKASLINHRFSSYISIDNSEDSMAYYYLALGKFNFAKKNMYQTIYYLKKVFKNKSIKTKNKSVIYRAYYVMAIAYASNSMLDSAIKYIDKCLEEECPLDRVQIKLMKARMLGQNKEYTKAITLIDELYLNTPTQELQNRLTQEKFMIAIMNKQNDDAHDIYCANKVSIEQNVPDLFLYSYYLEQSLIDKIDIEAVKDKISNELASKKDYCLEYVSLLVEYYLKIKDTNSANYYFEMFRKYNSTFKREKSSSQLEYFEELANSYEALSNQDIIKKELHYEKLSSELEQSIIGKSLVINKIKKESSNVAKASFSNVLLQGETGVGKELLAKYIHYASNRNKHNFCELNLASITPNLIESELFGYKKGAFTGAHKDKLGLLNIADNGTLFLDEVSEIPLDLQAKLLKVLEEKEFYPLGSTVSTKSDFRIISASNKNLLELVNQNKFRLDLYYRLCNYEINIPPLRERAKDILLIAEHFLEYYCSKLNIDKPIFDEEANALLMGYSYPGNVRELKNIMQRISISLINNEDIHYILKCYFGLNNTNNQESMTKELKLDEVIKNAVIDALKQTNGVQSQAAKLLGITANSIARRIHKYKLYDYCK